MYEIHQTKGYVLSYYNAGEADRVYRILTPDLGVVVATAISVRKESSKLKHFLGLQNHIDLECIESRTGLRITGGGLIDSALDTDRSDQIVMAHIADLIGRLSQGSEEGSNLYSLYQEIHQACESENDTSVVLEWGRARILQEFGYFNPEFSPLLPAELFESVELLAKHYDSLSTQLPSLQRYLKHCIDQTHL